jgi:asparagine synthase (glutamine-hydrolysing)
MCGIAGYWQPTRPLEQPRAILGDMLRSIRHRGPDGEGVHIDPEAGLAMGHTRLSIIDLQTGGQPLYDHDRRIVLTVNGEFYDYKRIRTDLICRGERFQTKSDSEIAIPLYRRRGLDFVHDLRGEFAVALFDADRERLLLVRDRFGVKPLYYRLTEDTVYYGSEVKAILVHPDVTARLCRRAALHQMMQVMVPGTTAFEGVEALLPGHMLIVERDGYGRLAGRQMQYWDFVFPEAAEHDPAPNPDAYVAGVRGILLDSVATRLEADVPVGCYLSGGIDSCSILGLATSLQQSHVKAFTISFDHGDYDESHIAREMAERTQADQEVMRLAADDLYGASFEQVARHAERTFYNTLAVAKWHMSRRVRECGYKVVVTGEGSDELFGGYPFFKRDFLLHATPDGGPPGQAEAAGQVFEGAILAESHQTHPAWEQLCGFTPSWIQPWMLTLEQIRPLLSDETREVLRAYDPIAAIAGAIDPAKVRRRHALDVAQYTWSKTMLEGQILTWGGDRVDMANSMESRPAFLDHNLAEFAVRIPPSLRVRNGVEKWVLREAMKNVLPEVLYKREKFAFMAPPIHTDDAKRRSAMSLVSRWLTADRIQEAELFDAIRVRQFLEEIDDQGEPVAARRMDIILNHLIQMHILEEMGTRCRQTGLSTANA